ncbi:serine/arginine repetitive matrix protein 3 isoform X2 [Hoplias malabaricus]|uniref:serine/arginine repetitive matrix protein 3 isoform X2 n=1 Tax=Hoplias malabaricus TaxID=27720 RepID=UPI00346329C6
MYDGARVPSPGDGANGVPLQPAVRPKAEEEPEKEEGVKQPEPVLVKKAHREILDHERKRRVELKCMELQEMMEEQGYSEEEIRQKVGTFRQMLMEKEGVITREGSHPRPQVTVLPHGDEEGAEGRPFADGYEGDYGWRGDYYDQDSVAHDDYRTKRKSSSSPSPPPKKRKKKKGRRHSRVDSSSPVRRGKRKKSGKKHKRDRSTSGSRRKRRHRSGTPKNKHKDKSKLRKKSPVESASRRPQHRGSCCSSRSASISSIASISKSPSRSNLKHRTDGHKPSGRSSHSPSPSLDPEHATYRQNGHHSSRVRNGKDSGPNHLQGEKASDKLRSLASSSPSEAQRQTSPNVREAKGHIASSRTPGGLTLGEPGKWDERQQQRGAKHPSESAGRRGGRQRAQEKSGHSPAQSSDSQTDLQSKVKSTHQKRVKVSHSSKKHHRGKAPNRHRSTSASPGRHRHTSGRKKNKSVRQRSSSWSSGRSSSRSISRGHTTSKTKSPHTRQNNSRERDSPHYSDAERARRRSRSYSPIRKRRRDSPSFMEARRITSARKRPIPYYRPSPSSSSSASSYSSSSRSRSRSYDSYSSYSRSRSHSRSRSRSRSKSSRSRSRSFSRSPSQAQSYYSHSSYESPGF